ncbi:MAG: TolC family protein [Proteobacteria bacterium]|nr:MAG: TolC family protein [Pseudomonadota bacterium]
MRGLFFSPCTAFRYKIRLKESSPVPTQRVFCMIPMTPKSICNGLIALAAFTYVSAAQAYTLRELYDKALVYSETVQSANLDVKITESNQEFTRKALKPRVSLGADGSYHVNKYDRENWANDRVAGLRTEFRQPIYDGGNTAAALKVSDANIEAYKWDVKTAEQTLYLRVASLFYEWVTQSQDIKNLEETLRLLERRVGDLGAWEKIGRARNAEVYLELSLEEIRPKVSSNQQKSDASEPDYKLPTIEAAEARVEAATRSIELTKTDLKPRFDFIAGHQWSYLDPTEQGAHDFSFGVGLTWLIYDSGQINAAVTTANLIKTQATVQKELADREGNLFLGIASRRLEDSLVQIRAYQDALKVVEKTLGAQREEYDSGLITNIELLTILDQRLQIRRNLDLALNRAKLIFVQSEVYSGNWIKKQEP